MFGFFIDDGARLSVPRSLDDAVDLMAAPLFRK